jgi:hypothetical protein
MAEVQKNNPSQSGEMAQLFAQFVLMQAQNILFVLGKLPTPYGERMEPNLETGKVLIDQLLMIREKTSGNLSKPEIKILEDALSKVQMAFVEASGGTPASLMPSRPMNIPMPEDEDEDSPKEPAQPTTSAQPPQPAHSADPTPPPKPDEESQKKFFKSYG